MPHVLDLLAQLALPRDAVLGHVTELVVQPVEALADDRGLGGSMLGLRQGGPLGTAAPTGEQHAHRRAEGDAHEQHDEQ